jgi:hypothetical protein
LKQAIIEITVDGRMLVDIDQFALVFLVLAVDVEIGRGLPDHLDDPALLACILETRAKALTDAGMRAHRDACRIDRVESCEIRRYSPSPDCASVDHSMSRSHVPFCHRIYSHGRSSPHPRAHSRSIDPARPRPAYTSPNWNQ